MTADETFKRCEKCGGLMERALVSDPSAPTEAKMVYLCERADTCGHEEAEQKGAGT